MTNGLSCLSIIYQNNTHIVNHSRLGVFQLNITDYARDKRTALCRNIYVLMYKYRKKNCKMYYLFYLKKTYDRKTSLNILY